jgi:hypothetical protein
VGAFSDFGRLFPSRLVRAAENASPLRRAEKEPETGYVFEGRSRTLTACFTSAYGRSPVRSGSYLALAPRAECTGDDPPPLRRFSPAEVLRLLGFPAAFRLPPELPRDAAWHLAGNSLSLPAVRAVLAAVPPLAGRLPAA